MSPGLDMHALNARLLRFRSHPEQEDAHALAEDLIAACRYGDARGVAVSAQTDDDASDARLLVLEARAWYMDRDLVRAQAALVRAARRDPNCAEAFRWLGEVLLKRGDPPRALRALERAAELAPHDDDAVRLLERARQLARHAPSAAQPAASIEALAPDDAPTSHYRREPAAASGPQSQDREGRASRGEVAGDGERSPARRSSPSGLGWQPVAARSSASGATNAARPISSPGSARAPASRSSAGGEVAAPRRSSSSGSLASPASRSSAGGEVAAPRRSSSSGSLASPSPRSSSGERAAAGSQVTSARPSSPGSLRSAFGLGGSPRPPEPAGHGVSRTSSAAGTTRAASEPRAPSRPLAASWDAPSVMASWPALEPLSQPPARGEALDEPELAAAADVEESPSDTEPTGLIVQLEELDAGSPDALEKAPDLALGTGADGPDEPEALLQALEAQGIFEPEAASSQKPPAWAPPDQVPRTGTRLRNAVIGTWVTALLLFGGGYFGWQQWIAQRHARAAELVAQARAAAFDGDHARLLDAERLLREARDKHPRSAEVPAAELFVHVQRVLENGSRELSALRASLARAERLEADPGHVAVARAVLASYSGSTAELQPLIDAAAKAAKGEPALLYAVGRLQQRLGQPEAAAQLRAAADAAPELIAAALALAELQHEDGATKEALAVLDAVLARKPDHVRARLWRAFITADGEEPARALAALDGLGKQARAGAPIDQILWALARARLLSRQGAAEKAGEALGEALSAGTSEPRLLALIATEARRAGQLGLAQQAAGQALAAAPRSPAYRALLASILLARNDGDRALKLLSDLPEDNPALELMRARAALQTGDAAALRDARAAMQARIAAGDKSAEVLALGLRLRAAIEPSSSLLKEAKALLRRSPSDPEALLALGEVALALREPKEATRAFEQLTKLAPDDAEAHYLLGRARRMAADAEEAEQALRRALELSPGNVGALSALGGLLLDTGKYEQADAVYQDLSEHSLLSGRLGRAEALLALGRLDDAAAQVSGLPDSSRDHPLAREASARVALARGKPGDAISALRPVIEAESPAATALALYGDALYAADQVNAAAGAYERALERDAGLPEALLGRAIVHLRAERPSDALELLEQLRDELEARLRAPEFHARFLTQLGRAHVQRDKRGDAERGRDALRKAVRLPNPPAEAYFWLGESLGGRKTPEAAAAFKRYIELEPKGFYAERAKRALGPLL